MELASTGSAHRGREREREREGLTQQRLLLGMQLKKSSICTTLLRAQKRTAAVADFKKKTPQNALLSDMTGIP